jgi:hypothetical protein
MEMRAVVQYRGEFAHYEITPDKQGIYQARLLKYEGPSGQTPPQTVLLVKSFRHWTGSFSEPYFIEALGKAIEERNREGDPAS